VTPSPVDALVRERVGLDPTTLGPAVLPRAAAARMKARALVAPEAYAGLLSVDAAEWTALLAELLVAETWFFRGGRVLFDHLAGWVRERACGANPRPVRVLSIPCSTGEEPLSLAFALDEQGVPPAAVRIDGVDLSEAHLARAAAGVYTSFSFREPTLDPRDRCFVAAGDNRWRLLPRYRTVVHYRGGNVIDPEFLAGETPYDLILCRNLFIYLTPDARRRALANLDRVLATDGRLCLTPTEADRLPPGGFVPDGSPAFALFRRADARTSGPGSGSIPVGPRSDRIPVADGRATGGPSSGRIPVEPAPPASGRIPVPDLRPTAGPPGGGVPTAPPASGRTPTPDPRPESNPQSPPPVPLPPDPRSLADAGRLVEALAACEQLLRSLPPTPDLFTLLGVIHLAAGRRSDAADAFRKALYLNPDHPEALSHSIVLHERCGEAERAAALRQRLARAERRRPA
jgi:chemotaxis protein methyltransferase WspC